MGGRGRVIDFVILAFASVGAPYVLLQAAGTALFLETHGASSLPEVYLAVAAAAALTALVSLRLVRRFGLRRVVLGALVWRAAMAVALKIGMSLGYVYETSFLAAVWARVDFLVGSMSLWSILNEEFKGPEARRLFPVFTACEPAAILAGGLAIAPLLVYLAPQDLFVVAAGMILVALSPLVLTEAFGEDETTRRRRLQGAIFARRGGQRRLSRTLRGYLTLIFGVMGAWTLAHYLLDNLFFTLAKKSFADTKTLAAFIGYTLSASGAVSLALLFLGSRRLVERLGLRGGLLGLPLLLATLTGLTLAIAHGLESGVIFFAAITAMKALERALLSGLYRPAYRTLFQPLPETHRRRAIAQSEGVAQPIGIAVSALLLIAANQIFANDPAAFAALLMVVTGVWIGLVMLTQRGYVSALERALRRRQTFEDIALGAADRRGREMVQQMIREGGGDDVVGAARIQAALDPAGFVHIAPRLIARGDPDTVRQLVSTVKEVEQPVFFPPMAGRLMVEDDAPLRDALLTAAAATRHPNSPRLLAKALADSPEAPPLGALIGLGRDGGAYGAAMSAQFLERYALKGDEALLRTLEAISLIGENGPSGPVAMGLRSPDRKIRAAAIRAAGKLNDAILAPLLAERMMDKRDRRAATLALSSLGSAAIETLAQIAGDREAPEGQRISAIRALGGIDEPEAHEHVFHHIGSPRMRIASASHLALWRTGVVAPREMAETVLGSSRAMMRRAAEAALARAALSGLEDGVYADPLTYTTQRLIARSVRAAGLLRPRDGAATARLAALFGQGRDRALDMKMAEGFLPSDLARVLRAMAGGARDAAYDSRALRAFVGHEGGDAEDWLGFIAFQADWSSDWLRALALRGLGRMNPDRIPGLLEQMESPGPVMREAAARLEAEYRGDADMSLSTIEKVLILRSTDLFSQVPDEDLAEIAPFLESVYLDPGEVVIREGEVGHELYILVTGEVKVEREGVELSMMSEGAVFGDLAALDPEPRAATVTATTPTHALALSNEHLLGLFESNVEIAAGVIATLVRRLRGSDRY